MLDFNIAAVERETGLSKDVLRMWERRYGFPVPERDANGDEVLSHMELLRLAMPRRVFTLSQVKYAVDRISWLYQHRTLIGGLAFTDEPAILRFFYGRLKPLSDWQQKLVAQFRQDFGDSL